MFICVYVYICVLNVQATEIAIGILLRRSGSKKPIVNTTTIPSKSMTMSIRLAIPALDG